MKFTPFDIGSLFEKARKFKGPAGAHPPYTIHKVGDLFYVKNSLGLKKNLKGYKTRAQAEQLQKALYAALPPAVKRKFG